jgi:HSP20 family protein
LFFTQKKGTKMSKNRITLAPETVAFADRVTHKLVVELAIPGAPTDTIDVKVLGDSIQMTAPARDIEYVAALALTWEVKPDKAEATYGHGLLRIEVPFKDPMEDTVIRTVVAETMLATITTAAVSPLVRRGSSKPLVDQPAPNAPLTPRAAERANEFNDDRCLGGGAKHHVATLANKE